MARLITADARRTPTGYPQGHPQRQLRHLHPAGNGRNRLDRQAHAQASDRRATKSQRGDNFAASPPCSANRPRRRCGLPARFDRSARSRKAARPAPTTREPTRQRCASRLPRLGGAARGRPSRTPGPASRRTTRPRISTSGRVQAADKFGWRERKSLRPRGTTPCVAPTAGETIFPRRQRSVRTKNIALHRSPHRIPNNVQPGANSRAKQRRHQRLQSLKALRFRDFKTHAHALPRRNASNCALQHQRRLHAKARLKSRANPQRLIDLNEHSVRADFAHTRAQSR